jgi:hypothetical protein
MKYFLVATLSMFLCSTSFAQFKAGPELTGWPGNAYECGIVSLEPRDRDSDPIYKIDINLSFAEDDKTKVTEMNVVHTSVTGKNYPRSDQYGPATLNQVSNHADLSWRGVWKKNNAVYMVGRFWMDGDGRLKYVEVQSRNGSPQMKMLSICHVISDAVE